MTNPSTRARELLVERLRRKCHGTNDSDAATMAEAASTITQLEARVAELVRALEGLMDSGENDWEGLMAAQDRARAALATPSPAPAEQIAENANCPAPVREGELIDKVADEVTEAVSLTYRLSGGAYIDPCTKPKVKRILAARLSSLQTVREEALEEVDVLLDELIGKESSPQFYGINGVLLGKLQTIQLGVRSAIRALTQRSEP